MSIADPNQSITPAPAIQSLATACLFNTPNIPSASVQSPIDLFLNNTKEINKIFASQNVTPALGSLVLLGYVSAFESYVRAVVRRIINIDEFAMSLNEGSNVHFGAALHQSAEMLPEALLEGTSFASVQNVKDVIKKRIGIKGRIPADVELALNKFQPICELRHCVVHRFGSLGAKNAIKLGLSDHRGLIEHSLALDQQALNKIALIVIAVAKTINSFLFDSLIERVATNKDDSGKPIYNESWIWDYRKDRTRFLTYYRIFSLTVEPTPTPQAFDLYDQLRESVLKTV